MCERVWVSNKKAGLAVEVAKDSPDLLSLLLLLFSILTCAKVSKSESKGGGGGGDTFKATMLDQTYMNCEEII